MPGRQTLAFVALLASVGVPYASSNFQALFSSFSHLVSGPKDAPPATAAMPSVVSKPPVPSTPSVAVSQTTPKQTVAQPVVWPSWGKKNSASEDSSDSDSSSSYNKSRSSSSDNNYSNSRGSGSQGNYSSSGSSGSDYSSGNSSSGNYSGSKNYGSKSGTNNSGSYNSGSYNSGSYNSGSSNSSSGSGSSYGSSSYGNNDYSSSRSSSDDDDSSSGGGYNEYKSSGSNYSSGSGSDYSSKPSYGSGYSSSGYGSSNNYGSSSSSYNNRGNNGSGNSNSSSYWGSSGNYSSSSDRDSYSRDRRRRTPLEDTDFGAPKPGDPPKYDPRELTDVFQFSVTPEWIFQRWPRVSTGLSQLDLHGYRVPLITGTAEHDLAGSLTYYFDKNQQLDRIMFKGTTGDPERVIRLLTTYYGFTRQKTTDPGLHLYQVKRTGKTISELRIKPSKVVRADSPRSRYQIDMVIARR